MNIERLMNEFDDEGIKNNYNEWIKVISDVYINNKGGEISLNKFQYNYLLSKLVEVINEKLHSDIELNMMEVEVFLHSIICYVLDELYIKSLKWYEYMEPDGEILKDDTWNGACKRTIDESFVYYNMKILKKLVIKILDLMRD